MLKQRVITAVILLAVLLAALLASNAWPLVCLLTLAASCALWEWLRLTWPGAVTDKAVNGGGPLLCSILLAVALTILVFQWLSPVPATWAVSAKAALNDGVIPFVALMWVAGATALVVQGRAAARSGGAYLSVFAVLAVAAVWAALVQLYLVHGAWFLVSLLALIWFADIAAYFTGKALGKHKLAPKVSPGKTWEGALGGVVAATLWVVISSFWPNSFGAVLAQHWPLWGVVVIAAFLAAISIVGDLFESLLKRRAGVKDSSQLLPGHGGVFDRIDALLPVAPIAFVLTGGWVQ